MPYVLTPPSGSYGPYYQSRSPGSSPLPLISVDEYWDSFGQRRRRLEISPTWLGVAAVVGSIGAFGFGREVARQLFGT